MDRGIVRKELPMASAATTPGLPVLSPEVLTFAEEQGVGDYLRPVVEMTRRLFPDARRLAVFVEEDLEIPDERSIILNVVMAGLDPDQYVEARFRWSRELFAICPAPLVCVFGLGLEIVEE
jgi:hypothetical protein